MITNLCMFTVITMKWKYMLKCGSLACVTVLLVLNVIYNFVPKLTISRSIKRAIREQSNTVIVRHDRNCANVCSVMHIKTSRDKVYDYFTEKIKLDKPPVMTWVAKENTLTFCDAKITIYDNLFGILHDVTMYPLRRQNIEIQGKGGEQIKDVLNQGLDKENYVFNSDFLEMNCKANENIKDKTKYMPRLMQNLKIYEADGKSILNNSTQDHTVYVVAVRREDYANLHNWVRNIYNTFLVMMHFKVQPRNIRILFMDGHPATELDKAWSVLYGVPLRVGHLEQKLLIRNLILGIDESQGPVSDYKNIEVPYLEEFRNFVLSQFDLDNDVKLDCSTLKITIIIRRNGVYHPRNVEGKVGRKIFNEAELVNNLMKAFPTACVRPVLMDALPMTSQLDVIRNTDVLIGMHGAGMSHSLFLPKHAGILELFSRGFKENRPWYRCYQSIASWRGLKYSTWENFDMSLEMPADFTVLPTQTIVNKTKELVKNVCNNTINKIHNLT